jgi:hypothetical protein
VRTAGLDETLGDAATQTGIPTDLYGLPFGDGLFGRLVRRELAACTA